MPINPEIAMSIAPIKIDNPLDSAGKALALKQLVLQNQQGQQSFDEQQRMRNILLSAGGDTSKMRDLLFQGGFPDKAIALDKDITSQKQGVATLAETQGKINEQKSKQESQMAAAFANLPPEQRQAEYPAFVKAWNANGLTGPNGPGTIQNEQWDEKFLPHLQAIAARGLTPEQSGEKAAYAAAGAVGSGKLVQPQQAMPTTPQDITVPESGGPDLPGATQAQATVRPLTLQQPQGTPIDQNTPPPVQSAPTVNVTAKPPVVSPDDLRAQATVLRQQGTKQSIELAKELMSQANQLDERALQEQGLTQAAKHQKAEEANQAEQRKQAWLTIDPFGTLRNAATNFSAKPGGTAGAPGADQASGDDFLKSIPKPLGDQVKALAEGRLAFPAGMALKSPYWQNMLQMVSQYDPTFDAINYNARVATRKDFTSGTAAKSATALNTVIGHLNTLSDAADALNNTSFPAYNNIANWMLNNSGDPRVKEFDNTRKAVVDELTRVWRGTGGSEGDIKSWTDTMNAANSPAQLHGVIANVGHLLESRIEALNEQYKRGMGTSEQGMQLLTPQSRSSLSTLEQKATTGTSTKGITATNPQTGEKVISNDGGKTWQPLK